jgi:hypothetical protein
MPRAMAALEETIIVRKESFSSNGEPFFPPENP